MYCASVDRGQNAHLDMKKTKKKKATTVIFVFFPSTSPSQRQTERDRSGFDDEMASKTTTTVPNVRHGRLDSTWAVAQFYLCYLLPGLTLASVAARHHLHDATSTDATKTDTNNNMLRVLGR